MNYKYEFMIYINENFYLFQVKKFNNSDSNSKKSNNKR